MPVTIDNRCNGCGACSFVCPVSCIDMSDDEEGFTFPRVDMDTCIDCGRCVRACPLNVQTLSDSQEALSFTSNDAQILDNSASGGAFSTMAKAFIDEGGIVVGVSDDVCRGSHFIAVREGSNLKLIGGSKYYQCNLGDGGIGLVGDLLAAGNKVLFGGTPCQVQALRNSFPGRRGKGLYLADIVCQGVPSAFSIDAYRREQEQQEGSDLETHLFRAKLVGHEGEYITVLDFADGERKTRIGAEDPCARAFIYQVSLRESCYRCPFAQTQRAGDVTLGDYWSPGLGDGFTRGSTSLVLVNTQAGQELAYSLLSRGRAISVPVEVGVAGNVPLHHPVARPHARSAFYPLLNKVGFARASSLCCWRFAAKKLLHLFGR